MTFQSSNCWLRLEIFQGLIQVRAQSPALIKAQGFKAQILQAPSNSTLQLGVPSPQKPNGHYFECQQTIFCSRESSFRLSDKSRVFFLSFSHQMSPHVVEKILIDNTQHRLAPKSVIKCCSSVVECTPLIKVTLIRILPRTEGEYYETKLCYSIS